MSADDLQKDSLTRINGWISRLESQVQQLLESCQPDELAPAQAMNIAGKFITLIARLLALRQQFANDTSSDEERILKIIFAEKHEQLFIEPAAQDREE